MKSRVLFLLLTVALGAQAEIQPGTPEAAQAMATPYLAGRFILVAQPVVQGQEATVKTLFMGQQCTLNMVRVPETQNNYGWSVHGSVCGALTGEEQEKWINEANPVRGALLRSDLAK